MNTMWDERYDRDDYLFGTEPNKFLVSQAHLLRPGMACLAVADGEGRNGVWLAQQGLNVVSVDSSSKAVEKARRLAESNGVHLQHEVADLLSWQWGFNSFDVIVAIFIQFAGPAERTRMFEEMRQALRPGGLLIMQGYTPRQLEYGTGGPLYAENMYTPELIREAFSDMDVLLLKEHDDFITEGAGHHGLSALLDIVIHKPANSIL